MRFKSVFFDLDGTLTDPREGIINCIQGALKEYQIPCPARNDLEWCIGPPLKHSFLDLGAQPEQVEHRMEEIDSLRAAMDWAQPGDLIAAMLAKASIFQPPLF